MAKHNININYRYTGNIRNNILLNKNDSYDLDVNVKILKDKATNLIIDDIFNFFKLNSVKNFRLPLEKLKKY